MHNKRDIESIRLHKRDKIKHPKFKTDNLKKKRASLMRIFAFQSLQRYFFKKDQQVKQKIMPHKNNKNTMSDWRTKLEF